MASKSFYDIIRTAPKGRFLGIKRNYTVEDVLKLRGSWPIAYSVSTLTSNKLWQMLHSEPYIHALGAYTGGQAVQMARAGLRAIYLSGWQVAADANSSGQMYPDQSLYSANSGPLLAERINNALHRADQIETAEGGGPQKVSPGWQVAADANSSGQMYPDQSLYSANSGPLLADRINNALHRADQIETAEGGGPQKVSPGWQVAADANSSGQMYPDQSLYSANSGPLLAERINNALHRADQIETAEGGGPQKVSPGWQVAADANSSGQMYPDQSLYSANSGPLLAERINNALHRADQIETAEGGGPQKVSPGWQVAADANSSGQMYPDQSLYSANSGPLLAERINNALHRADQIETAEGGGPQKDWLKPIVADAEAGFGGSLNCYELTRSYIKAGVAGIHLEDQLGSEKKCGHMGGKVLIPTSEHVRHLNACRLAADVANVPTVFIARTDAESALLLTNDIDEHDHEFIDREAGRTEEGFFRLKQGSGLAHCIKRGLAFAPYSDLLWMETSTPNLQVAKEFAEGIKKVYPDKMLAYNCSPSFKWSSAMTQAEAENFQRELGAMGYRFQFVTLAGFHLNNYGSFELARQYRDRGMGAYMQLQENEFQAEKVGYTAVKHQREVGTSYFDAVSNAVSGGKASTTALSGSTEEAQFFPGEGESEAERPFLVREVGQERELTSTMEKEQTAATTSTMSTAQAEPQLSEDDPRFKVNHYHIRRERRMAN